LDSISVSQARNCSVEQAEAHVIVRFLLGLFLLLLHGWGSGSGTISRGSSGSNWDTAST
jgi:hypothetical protein